MSDKPQSGPCSAPEHRQFDFWIGTWDVTTLDGRLAGRNTISRKLEGCVIHEQWDGSGMRGESFNIWDRAGRRWHQTWVSSRGELLLLDGGFSGGAMRLSGESGPPERRIRNRITWTPGPDDTLRQVWDVSRDGREWRTVFDGTYRRVKREE